MAHALVRLIMMTSPKVLGKREFVGFPGIPMEDVLMNFPLLCQFPSGLASCFMSEVHPQFFA
jgi:hypothetical protein